VRRSGGISLARRDPLRRAPPACTIVGQVIHGARMVGSWDGVDVVAMAAREFDDFDPATRRNVAILHARMRRDGAQDTYALAAMAARRASGDAIPKAELRTADRHAALALLAALEPLDATPEGRRALKRIGYLLHAMVTRIAGLPAGLRADALAEVVGRAGGPEATPRPAAGG